MQFLFICLPTFVFVTRRSLLHFRFCFGAHSDTFPFVSGALWHFPFCFAGALLHFPFCFYEIPHPQFSNEVNSLAKKKTNQYFW